MTRRRRLAIALTAAATTALLVLLCAGGCALILREPRLPVVPQQELAATADTYAAATAETLGVPTPTRGGGPQPCTDDSNGPNDNTYILWGIYSFTISEVTADSAVRRIVIEWEGQGYRVGEPQFLADGRFNELYGYDPAKRFNLFLRGTSSDNVLVLRVTSPCVEAPADEDPN